MADAPRVEVFAVCSSCAGSGKNEWGETDDARNLPCRRCKGAGQFVITATATGRSALLLRLGEAYDAAMAAYSAWLSGPKERGEPGPHRERLALDAALAALRAHDERGGEG